MKSPEKNGVAKLGYAATMIIVTTAILICMKRKINLKPYFLLQKIIIGI